MSKKVLVITSSLRANSNSDALADSFADGAKSSGNTVEVISLKDHYKHTPVPLYCYL